MRRRKFIGRALGGGAIIGGTSNLGVTSYSYAEQKRQAVKVQENGKYEILLKGGHVIDPANNINGIMDVAVAEGKIARVEKNIPARDAKRTIDVSDLYVTPGLLDIHLHCFHSRPRYIIADDHCFPSGVTTCCDAGSAGADSFEDFIEIIESARTRILIFLNISSAQGTPKADRDNPTFFDILLAVETAKKYSDIIIGFKTIHYKTFTPLDKDHPPWAAIDAIIEAGRLADLPCMIHSEPRPPSDGFPARSFREMILQKLRPGDIHTHCHGFASPPMLGDTPPDKINPDVFKAKKRGVIFDVGHGAGSFTFRNAVPSIEQGFLPDSISTDLYAANTCGSVFNMNNVMSKFICMGMSVEDVIRRTTV
ncbi:MAG: hypothetical protein HOC71_18705, partial [Candidatus Latescibacteria bacterium]|nr:hypothetical protein [Candidatus Latescibacterota bacterium]